MSGRRLLGGSLLGALDQAVLSGFSLIVGIAFIRLVPKAEYALYTLMTTSLLLANSFQNALVASPLTTLMSARADASGRARVLAAANRLQSWLSFGLVGLAGVAAAAIAVRGGEDASLAVALGAASLGVLAREYVRAKAFIERNALRALLSDLGYVAAASAAIGVLVAADALSAVSATLAIGIAGAATGWLSGVGWTSPFARRGAEERAELKALWDCARWALPSVLNSWLYANAFLFIVEALVSRDAVADLSASRLLLVPVSMVVVGWTNAFRPRASRLYADDRLPELHALALRSALALSIVTVGYGVLLWAAMPWLQSAVLGAKYAAADRHAAVWLAFFVANALRSVGMACMLASPLGFRTMYFYSWLGLGLALPAVLAACLAGSVDGVVAALAAAEAVLAAVIWLVGWPKLRRAR